MEYDYIDGKLSLRTEPQEEYDLYLKLLPTGRYARLGIYKNVNTRRLSFHISLSKAFARNYETLKIGEMDTLRITGFTKKSSSGHQCIDDILAFRNRVPIDKLEDFDRLIKIWREYHLNDFTAGTKNQENLLKRLSPEPDKLDYLKRCEYLKEHELFEDSIDDIKYVYGTFWLCKPIKPDDMEFIRRICREWGTDEMKGDSKDD